MSLRLEKNNSSIDQDILLTLSDGLSAITSGQSYYFEFEFEQTGQKFTKTLTDFSLYPWRYNLFSVKTTGSTENVIPFSLEGWYRYNVYLYSGSTFSLEMGKCLVFSNENPIETKYTPTIEKYVYKK